MSGRSLAEILNDPTASEAELTLLAKRYPAEVARHPNCPGELWWGFLRTDRVSDVYAIDALMSPAAVLYQLDLDRFTEAERTNARSWIRCYAGRLRSQQRENFIGDCMLRALDAVAEQMTDDVADKVAQSIEARLNGHAKRAGIFRDEAVQMVTSMFGAFSDWPFGVAAVFTALDERIPEDVAGVVSGAIAYGKNPLGGGRWRADEIDAVIWIWHRLFAYLQREN